MLISTLRIFLLVVALAYSGTAHAYSDQLQIGVSTEMVPVDSGFNGTTIYVFGSIEDPVPSAVELKEYAVVLSVSGPLNDLVVRKKERVLGIWINRHTRTYAKVPGFYSLVSADAVSGTADAAELKQNGIGIENQDLNLLSRGTQTFIQPAPEFAKALRRIRKENKLFVEQLGSLTFIGKTLFRASVDLPANIPIGEHKVTAHLFRLGKLIDTKTASFSVQKVGFERWIYDLAHKNGFLYGVMAVLLAVATGWLANVLFRRD